MYEIVWAKTTSLWTQKNSKRQHGKLRRRWQNELDVFMKEWQSIALGRQEWIKRGEAFALQAYNNNDVV